MINETEKIEFIANLGVFAYVSPHVGKLFIDGNDVYNVSIDA